jgi:putative endonuclease
VALSRPKRGFESRWGRQTSLACGELRLGKPASRCREGCPAEAAERRRRTTPRITSRASKATSELTATSEGVQVGHSCSLSDRRNYQLFYTSSPKRRLTPHSRWSASCERAHAMSPIKRFVYVLRSTVDPSRYYVGLTSDVAARLAVHNSGGSAHTADLRPWEFVTAVEFALQSSATAFEQYPEVGIGSRVRQAPFRLMLLNALERPSQWVPFRIVRCKSKHTASREIQHNRERMA